MLRLPSDIQAFLQSEARTIAPSEGVATDRSDALVAAIVAQSTDATITETRELIRWLADLSDLPALLDAPDGEQDLVRRLGARTLSSYAANLSDTASALADLKPEDVRNPGARMRARLRKAEIQSIAHEFIALASAIGPEAAVDALIAAKLTLEVDRDALTGVLAQYLGRTTGGRGHWIGVLKTFDAFGESPNIRAFLTHVLEVEVYRHLLQHGADELDLRQNTEHLAVIETQANACLDALWQKAGLDAAQHADLRQSVVDTFLAAATLPIPDVFVETINDHYGRPRPFPCFAQRVSVQRLLVHGDQYLCLPTGRGKTAIPLIAWEIRRRQPGGQDRQFLGIYPPSMTRAVANRLEPQPGMKDVQRYYKEGQAPGVGVIAEGIKDAPCAAALTQPIVLVSDTMLSAVRNERSIVDALSEQKRADLTYDELHRTNGGKTWTKNAQRLIDASQCASGTSATPQLNGSLAGIRAAATLLLRQDTAENRWAETERIRPDIDTSVAEFRAALRRVLFNPEPPSNWSSWFHQQRLTLNPAEARVMARITRDRELDAAQRHVQAELSLLAPWLFAGGERGEDPTMLQHLTLELRRLFEEKPDVHSSVVAVDWLKTGVFEPHEDYPGKETFFERLQGWVHAENHADAVHPLEIHAIWGATPQRQRERIFAAAQSAKERGVKVVILAHKECVNIGIDLRHIDDLRYLGHPTNLAILDQLSGRANRAGRTDVPLTLAYFGDTLQAGKRQLAHHRSKEELLALAPDQPITTRRFRRIYDPGVSAEADALEGRVLFHLEHPDERHDRMAQQMHGRGATVQQRHLDRAHPWSDWLSHRRQRDQLGSGDASRFVSAFALEQQRGLRDDIRTLPVVTFGAAGSVLTEDWRRLDPTMKAEIIECHPTERMRQHEQESVPPATEGTAISSTSVVLQAPHALREMHKKDRTLPESLQWGGAGHVVMTGLENFGWSNDDVMEREERQIERGRALIHARRLLCDGGRLTLFIPDTACTHAEFANLCANVLPMFGFVVFTHQSGVVTPEDTQVAGFSEQGRGGYMISAAAMTFEKFRPHWKSIRQQIPTNALAMTPRRDQTEGQQTNLRQRYRLPEQLIHQRFVVQSRDNGVQTYEYHHPLVRRQQQEARLIELGRIVREIRAFAPDKSSWQQPTTEMLETLHQLGAELDSSGKQPRFVLSAYPEDVFRPYDALWGATV